MYDLTIRNILDIATITFLFCFSLKISCLIKFNSKYKFILLTFLIYTTLFCIPIFTQLGSLLLVFLQLIIIIYFDNGSIKNKFINITYVYLITIISTLLSEVMVGTLLFLILKLDDNNSIYYCIYLISNISVGVLINIIINIIIKKYYKNLNTKNTKGIAKNDYLVIMNMVLLISMMGLVVIIYNYPYLKEFIMICIIIMCSIIVINQFIYANFYNDEIKSSKINTDLLRYNEQLEKYNNNLEENVKEIIGFNHDIKNMLFTLGELVEKSNNKKLKEFYFDKIYPISSNAIQKENIYRQLKDIENIYLKSFLYYKLCEIIEQNIAIEITIDGMFSNIQMDIIELVRILGIFLDNAVEEVVNLDTTYIKLQFIQNTKGEEYIIENPIRKNVDIGKIKNGYTTKGKSRGNGLIIVKNIVEKYNFITWNMDIKSDLFSQNLFMFYN